MYPRDGKHVPLSRPPEFQSGTGSEIVYALNSLALETRESLQARALILNTFEDLEGSVLSQMHLQFP